MPLLLTWRLQVHLACTDIFRLRNDSETKDDSATKTGWFWNQNRWFWNQGWFWNQNRWFWNQGWFRNQGPLETKNGTAQQSFSLGASSWLCHLETCMPDLANLLKHYAWHKGPASEDDVMLSVAASGSKEGTQLQGRYCPTPPHPTASEDDAMLSVTARMSRRERSCKDVIVPPHPTPPHLKTMPCWAWPQVCQRKERSCKDVIVPPHPTPPHPTASEDDAMLSVTARMLRRERSCTHCIWRRCHVECGTWRRCHAECRSTDLGCKVTRILVSESRGFWFPNRADFGCGIVCFWLRNRLVLVAESSFFGCGIFYFLVAEAPFFSCGIVEIWLRNRRNLVAEASKFGCGIGLYSHISLDLQGQIGATRNMCNVAPCNLALFTFPSSIDHTIRAPVPTRRTPICTCHLLFNCFFSDSGAKCAHQ